MPIETEVIEGLTKQLESTTTDLKKQQGELVEAHRLVLNKVESREKLDKELEAKIDEALAKANETGTLQQEIAQAIEDIKKGALKQPEKQNVNGVLLKALTEAHADEFEAIKNRSGRKLNMLLKDITSADVSVGMKTDPYTDTLVKLERQDLRIRNLLTQISVKSDSVRYGQQTVRENNARTVKEGTTKPYSNYAWAAKNANIVTIAHLAKLTMQAMEDAPRLVAEVSSELRYGLQLEEENRILNGAGGEDDISGLLLNATPYAPPANMDTSDILTGIDRLRIAMLQIQIAGAVADGHVLNSINVAEFDLMRRDPDNGGGYLFSRPDGDTGVLRLWRLPVVESVSMPVNQFLTGAFKYSVHLYDRMGIRVDISTENDDDFEKNLATLRCESRIGLGVIRPYGLVKGGLKAGGS